MSRCLIASQLCMSACHGRFKHTEGDAGAAEAERV